MWVSAATAAIGRLDPNSNYARPQPHSRAKSFIRLMKALAKLRILVAVWLLVGGLAVANACGGAGAQPAGSTEITLTEYKVSPSDVSVNAGRVTLYVVNGGTGLHNLAIYDSAGRIMAETAVLSVGDSSVLTVGNLKPGSYKMMCEGAGHMELGMSGNLTAK
jgi:plastocyanin